MPSFSRVKRPLRQLTRTQHPGAWKRLISEIRRTSRRDRRGGITRHDNLGDGDIPRARALIALGRDDLVGDVLGGIELETSQPAQMWRPQSMSRGPTQGTSQLSRGV